MKNKPQKKPRRSILLDGELIAVTDPVEFAELDRRCRAAEKAMGNGQHEPEKPKTAKKK
jgi:hypothetical protein